MNYLFIFSIDIPQLFIFPNSDFVRQVTSLSEKVNEINRTYLRQYESVVEDDTPKAAHKLYYTRVWFLFWHYMSLAVLIIFLEKPTALAMGHA